MARVLTFKPGLFYTWMVCRPNKNMANTGFAAHETDLMYFVQVCYEHDTPVVHGRHAKLLPVPVSLFPVVLSTGTMPPPRRLAA
jgi:hypothetical protein